MESGNEIRKVSERRRPMTGKKPERASGGISRNLDRSTQRRLLYVAFLVLLLALWVMFGDFDAVEAPYVDF